MSNLTADDVWTEIMGADLLRGGSERVAGDDAVGAEAYQLLGLAVAQKNPTALRIAQERIARSRAIVKHKPMEDAYDYTIDFGPASGSAATTSTLSFIPQMHVRVEKVSATDTGAVGGISAANPAGYGTGIQSIYIGADFQKAANSGVTLTAFYAQNALGNGVKWRTCKAALTMSVTVSFINLCTFYMSCFCKVLR